MQRYAAVNHIYVKNVKIYVNFVQMLFLLNIVLASSLFFHSLPFESTGINIRTLCQDQKGNIWFGGADGIVMYDGSRYYDYRYNDHIYKLICDYEGTVWAAHLAGLSEFDRSSGVYRNYPSPGGVIRDVLQISESRFLLVLGYRLWLFDSTDGSYSRDGISKPLSEFEANSLYRAGDIIYVGGSDGRILQLSIKLGILREIPASYGNIQVNCMLLDSDGSLWAGGEGNGLWNIPAGGGRHRHYHLDNVRTLCMDEDGGLWIGTKNGLNILRDGVLEEFHHDYYDSGSISHDSVLQILRDKQGTMWLGTYYGGACYCTSRPSLFRGIVARPGGRFLNGQVISDIVEDGDGSLWIGTNSGGLNHMLRSGGFEQIGGLGEAYSDQPDIKAIFKSAYSGCLYVGADKGPVSVLRPGSRRLRVLNSAVQNGSYAIEGTSDGILYIGTQEGLFRYDERSGKSTEMLALGVRNYVTALRLLRDGRLLIGHKFGVAAVDVATGEELQLPEGFSSLRYVEDFLEDSAGRVWISTGAGLFRYDADALTSFTVADGLPDNVVHGVEEDGSGRLWISTNRGLCRMDPSNGEKWIFTVADGLPGDRFTSYAHCRTRGGEMYFGGLSWLAGFNPETVRPVYKKVVPVISGLELGGVWSVVSQKQLKLKPKDRDLSIMFTAPDYMSGQNGHFRYKLEGERKTDVWHDAGADRTASYHGLEAGRYVFSVSYSNSAGIPSPEEAVLMFTIPPFWYETMVFKALWMLLLGMGAIGFVMYLFARKKAQYQSEMERVRNELLNEFSLDFVRIGANGTGTSESTVAKVFYKADEEFMRRAMQVVKDNLDNPDFTVEVLAEEMHMSRSNLHLRSKALFGVSCHEFIKTVRFNEACRLLQEKKYSVAEIGYMVGFTTPSYFAAAFHRFMGCTPTDYQRRNDRQNRP